MAPGGGGIQPGEIPAGLEPNPWANSAGEAERPQLPARQCPEQTAPARGTGTATKPPPSPPGPRAFCEPLPLLQPQSFSVGFPNFERAGCNKTGLRDQRMQRWAGTSGDGHQRFALVPSAPILGLITRLTPPEFKAFKLFLFKNATRMNTRGGFLRDQD